MRARLVWTWAVLMTAVAAAAWLVPHDWWGAIESSQPRDGTGAQAGDEAPHDDEATFGVGADSEGRRTLTVGPEFLARSGVVTEPPAAAEHQPQTSAYGRIEEDPNASFTLRSPVTGYLETNESASWPQLGQSLAAETLVGKVTPRLTPVERFDLTSRVSARLCAAPRSASRRS